MSTRQDAPPRTGYTIPEVARSIGISAQQLRRLVNRGEVEAKVIGGVKLIPAAVFHSLLDDAPSAAS